MLIGSLLLIAFPEILRFLNLYKYIIYGLILVVLMLSLIHIFPAGGKDRIYPDAPCGP